MEKFVELNEELYDEYDDKKWIPLTEDEVEIHKSVDYKELLKEIIQLKEIVSDLNNIVTIQNESINKVAENIETVKTDVIHVDKELLDMKQSAVTNSKFQFITNYVFPLIGIAVTYAPICYTLGPKMGVLGSTATYLFFKML
jgi:hypothetical protein